MDRAQVECRETGRGLGRASTVGLYPSGPREPLQILAGVGVSLHFRSLGLCHERIWVRGGSGLEERGEIGIQCH